MMWGLVRTKEAPPAIDQWEGLQVGNLLSHQEEDQQDDEDDEDDSADSVEHFRLLVGGSPIRVVYASCHTLSRDGASYGNDRRGRLDELLPELYPDDGAEDVRHGDDRDDDDLR